MDIFEKFSQKASLAIDLAKEETRRSGHNLIGTEQILLGLIAEGTGLAAKLLRVKGVDLKTARTQVKQIIGQGFSDPTREIAWTPRAEKVLQIALGIASDFGQDVVHVEHILLSLIRETEGVAFHVIENLGVDPFELNDLIISLMQEKDQGKIDECLQQIRTETKQALNRQQQIMEDRIYVYIDLINSLMNSAQEQKDIILSTNSNLINAELLQMMEQVAEVSVQEGNPLVRNWVINRIEELAQHPSFLKNVFGKRITQNQVVYPEEYLVFLGDLLRIIRHSHQPSEHLRYLLQENPEKLNPQLVQLFQTWVSLCLSLVSPSIGRNLAGSVCEFSRKIQEVPWGNRGINLELAIIGYEAVLQFSRDEISRDEQAKLKCNLGIAYRNRVYGKRAENIEKAISYYQTVLETHTQTRFPEYWAMAQMNLGVAYMQRIDGERSQNLESAIACFRAACQVYTKDAFALDFSLAQDNLASAYRERIEGDLAENFELAIACQEEALVACSRELFPKEWADIQNNTGVSYFNRIQGDRAENLERAIACYNHALQVYSSELFPSVWAKTLNNLGNAFCERIQGEKADNLDRAISCYRQVLFVITRDLPEPWAMTQANLGTAYNQRLTEDKQANAEQAIGCFSQALLEYTRDLFPKEWANAQLGLGAAYGRLIQDEAEQDGNASRAISCFSQALQVFTRRAFPIQFADTLFSLSLVYKKSKQLHRAHHVLAVALQTIESLSQHVLGGAQAKQKLADEWSKFYGLIVDICLELAIDQPHFYTTTLEYIERSKARSLVELVANQTLVPKGHIPPDSLNKLKQFNQAIRAEHRKRYLYDLPRSRESFVRRYSDEGALIPADVWPDLASTQLYQLQQQRDLELEKIKKIDPSFTFTQRVEPVSFRVIQQLLPDAQTCAIAWYIADEKILAFIVTRESETPVIWQSSAEDFKAFLNWIVEYVNSSYHEQQAGWGQDLAPQLEGLAKILHLDEIIDRVPETCTQLILIPHWFLHLLPLHAMPLSNGICLLERFPGSISYAPSFQLLQLVRDKNREKKSNFSNFFAVQNPTQDLAYADLEVTTIRQTFKPNDEVLVGELATKTTLSEKDLSQAHCIHFSCHGSFMLEFPLLSLLFLADSDLSLPWKESKTTDLFKCLSLGEIFEFDLSQCRLVTLSACETAVTNYKTVSEYIGFPTGFLCAGSASVVSSLWRVDDLSTAFLMIKFYQNLQKGLVVGLALNKAQLWLKNLTKVELETWIEENQLPLQPAVRMNLRRRLYKLEDDVQPFKSPFYWAAFCAVG